MLLCLLCALQPSFWGLCHRVPSKRPLCPPELPDGCIVSKLTPHCGQKALGSFGQVQRRDSGDPGATLEDNQHNQGVIEPSDELHTAIACQGDLAFWTKGNIHMYQQRGITGPSRLSNTEQNGPPYSKSWPHKPKDLERKDLSFRANQYQHIWRT